MWASCLEPTLAPPITSQELSKFAECEQAGKEDLILRQDVGVR